MKIALSIVIVLISISGFSQSVLNKDVAEFTDLKVYDQISVTMYSSDKENKVIVHGENPEDIKIVNQKGKLKIRMQKDKMYDGRGINVDVYYTSVDLIDANEGARILVKDVIKQKDISLRAQEGGHITIELEVEKAVIKAISGGEINTSGKAYSQEIKINAGGFYYGKDLETNHTTVAVTAAGRAEVNATNLVDAQVVAGGSIYIYGNPKEVNEKKLAGGKIERMD